MRSLLGLLLISSLAYHTQSHEHKHHHDEEGSAILSGIALSERLEELHDHHHHEHDYHDHDDHEDHHEGAQKNHTVHEKKHNSRLSTLKVWGFSLSAVVGISLAPCSLLFFIPAQHANGPFLKILLAFGAGGLLGDALLHIIPHSLSPHNHGHESLSHGHSHSKAHSHDDHSHDHSNELRVGIFVIAGILVFMLVEQMVRIIKGGHCHSHENGHIVADEHRHLNDHRNHEEKEQRVERIKDVKASAYLNLVADFVHNLTDGLAIGASFSAGSTLGWITTLTVLLHELPHEVGDFAILVQSGFSKYQAIRMQAVTALGAITGCIFSLLISNPGSLNNSADTSAIMPFTAGGFIYIATVSVIPELLESGDHNEMSKMAKMAQSLVHVLAICLGVGMMYIVSLVE
ncbi:unnamed protein product [Caenorhabditis brenneri]